MWQESKKEARIELTSQIGIIVLPGENSKVCYRPGKLVLSQEVIQRQARMACFRDECTMYILMQLLSLYLL